jgi:hypothetical protein
MFRLPEKESEKKKKSEELEDKLQDGTCSLG